MSKLTDEEIRALLKADQINRSYMEPIDVLRKHARYSEGIVALFDDREAVKKAFNDLESCPRNLFVRWSDPNYG
jgi:hypothetical protein